MEVNMYAWAWACVLVHVRLCMCVCMIEIAERRLHPKLEPTLCPPMAILEQRLIR